MQFTEFQLSDVCELINGGAWSDQEYADAGIPVVKVSNMSGGGITADNMSYIPWSSFEIYKKHQIYCQDLIVSTVGSHPTQPGSVVGKTAIIPKHLDGALLNQNAVCIRVVRKDLLCPKFLIYVSKTIFFKHHIESRARGSANQVRMALGELKKFTFRFPELTSQRKIAAILSAYDDLIENNKRRIAILEKMAEEIYREWFVRMRFPGHGQVAFHKGIPEGWEAKKLGDLVDTQYGYTASATDEPIGPKFLRITDIVPALIDWDNVPYCPIADNQLEQYLLKEGDIVVARTGATVGYAKRIHKSNPDSVFASYLIRLKAKCRLDNIFLGMAVESNRFKDFISMFFTGSAQPQANANVMSLFPILYPPPKLIRQFNSIVEPLIDQKENLCQQISCLQKTRDRLLPRLISGKLSVEDLEIQFPPSMAETDATHQ